MSKQLIETTELCTTCQGKAFATWLGTDLIQQAHEASTRMREELTRRYANNNMDVSSEAFRNYMDAREYNYHHGYLNALLVMSGQEPLYPDLLKPMGGAT